LDYTANVRYILGREHEFYEEKNTETEIEVEVEMDA